MIYVYEKEEGACFFVRFPIRPITLSAFMFFLQIIGMLVQVRLIEITKQFSHVLRNFP